MEGNASPFPSFSSDRRQKKIHGDDSAPPSSVHETLARAERHFSALCVTAKGIRLPLAWPILQE
jgi:hypothetical protein